MSDSDICLMSEGTSTERSSQPALTHYRCIKFEAKTEVEISIYKHKDNNDDKQSSNKQDDNLYLTLVSGQVETFGIPILVNRLVSLEFGQRIILQSFHNYELCFLISTQSLDIDICKKCYDSSSYYGSKNIHTGDLNQSTINVLTFLPLPKPFASYDRNSKLFDSKTLSSMVQWNNDRLKNEGKCSKSIQNIHWRLGLNVKSFKGKPGSKPLSWSYQSYIQIAKELNYSRSEAEKFNQTGPNIIILGPCDAGKSTFAKILINCALNENWSPMYVDLDVGQGSIGIPGTIGAGIIDKHCGLEQKYCYRNGFPLMVHYGYLTPETDVQAHKMAIDCLFHSVQSFFNSEKQLSATSTEKTNTNSKKYLKKMLSKWSGCIINTHGWINDYGYDSTIEACYKFSVGTVVVLGDYRLFERIHKDILGFYPGQGRSRRDLHRNTSSTKVLFVQRNYSTVKRNGFQRRRLRYERFEQYFNSISSSHVTLTIPFSNHTIYRFYVRDNFMRFLQNRYKENISLGGCDTEISKSSESITLDYYLTCNVERKGKNRSGSDYDQVVFYRIEKEILIYLMNRVLSVLAIKIDYLFPASSNRHSILTPKQVLQVKGFALVTQIDLENETFQILISKELSQEIVNGQAVLLIHNTSYDRDEILE